MEGGKAYLMTTGNNGFNKIEVPCRSPGLGSEKTGGWAGVGGADLVGGKPAGR